MVFREDNLLNLPSWMHVCNDYLLMPKNARLMHDLIVCLIWYTGLSVFMNAWWCVSFLCMDAWICMSFFFVPTPEHLILLIWGEESQLDVVYPLAIPQRGRTSLIWFGSKRRASLICVGDGAPYCMPLISPQSFLISKYFCLNSNAFYFSMF
jgi:hypothetical protein